MTTLIHARPPVRTTAPDGLPVTVDAVKKHLRVDHTDDDALIGSYLAAAVERLDGWSGILGRCLLTQTWRLDLACFSSRDLRLPFPDVASVDIAYTPPDGVEAEIDDAVLHLFNDVIGPVVRLADGASWPAIASRPDAVRVSMVAGYGDAEAVPAPIKAAIMLMTGDMYRFRETVMPGSTLEIPMSTTVNALLAPYRRVSF